MGAARRRSYGQPMTTTSAAPTLTKAAGLRRWMRVVGGFYLLMGVFNTPPVIQARFGAQYGELGLAVDSPPAQALVDDLPIYGGWVVIHLVIIVTGAAALRGSRADEGRSSHAAHSDR